MTQLTGKARVAQIDEQIGVARARWHKYVNGGDMRSAKIEEQVIDRLLDERNEIMKEE